MVEKRRGTLQMADTGTGAKYIIEILVELGTGHHAGDQTRYGFLPLGWTIPIWDENLAVASEQ